MESFSHFTVDFGGDRRHAGRRSPSCAAQARGTAVVAGAKESESHGSAIPGMKTIWSFNELFQEPLVRF